MCIDKRMGAVASIRGERSTRRHVQQVPPPQAKIRLPETVGSSSAAAVLVHFLGFHCPHHSVKIRLCRTIIIVNGRRTSGKKGCLLLHSDRPAEP